MYVLRMFLFQHVDFKEVWLLKSFGFYTLQYCVSQERKIMKVFEQNLQLRIKFVCFAHIPIPTCWFWRAMKVKIIWIWQTAILFLQERQVFEQYLQLRIKFVCFAHIPIPTFWFWNGMSVKIIWLWHTAIVYSQGRPKRCFQVHSD